MPRTSSVEKKLPKWKTDPVWALRRAIRKGRLDADTEKVFIGKLDTSLRYAKEVIRGRLPEYIEESIADAIENEEKPNRRSSSSIVNWILSYAEILKAPLPDRLHKILIKKYKEGVWPRRNISSYAKNFKQVPKEILNLVYEDSNVAVEYAVETNTKLPEKIEKNIIKNCDEDDVVKYAKKVYKGRLPESLEAAMTDHPETLYKYAKEIVFGQLPAHLHSAMIMKSFEEKDEWETGTIKCYLNFVKRTNNYVINYLNNLDPNTKVSDAIKELGEINYEVEDE